MNSVQLVGRLATEIELREVTGDSKVCSFILAVDRSGDEAELRFLPTRVQTTYSRRPFTDGPTVSCNKRVPSLFLGR